MIAFLPDSMISVRDEGVPVIPIACCICQVLKEGHNVLLLDEPTNDLDVETLRSLEDAIQDFAGSVLIVSHDRWFLDRVCSHTIAFEEELKDDSINSGRNVVVFPGNHSEYAKEATQRGVMGLDF